MLHKPEDPGFQKRITGIHSGELWYCEMTVNIRTMKTGFLLCFTLLDIYRNRKLFNQRVFEVASKDLYQLGLHVISYTIRDLSDKMVRVSYKF
ncbi:Flotillin-1 [Portunus trituberculatus]|uniref:Flotillin-1 n=1 Tax=Portunus trituberculatus TaxID=210409 RepID=A0A5B7F398_PORTR|nr:Flotillin-1 [Portunus trituberculatus]